MPPVNKFRQRKWDWPDDPDDIYELGDKALLKLWRYAPRAKNEHQVKRSLILCNELVDRDLK